MKIAFLCPALSRTVGGIFEIERRLAQSLALIPGTHLEIFGPADEHTDADLPTWQPLKPKSFACTGGNSFRYSSKLRDAFLSTTADISHIHALWMYNSILIHRWSQKQRSPYVVTPNGMLEPWALRNSGWKKRIASLLYERRMLSKAACIQANTEKEAADIRAYGLKNPIAIIPNGIDLPVLGNAETLKTETLKSERGRAPWAGVIEPGRKVLLFLSRIHPKKGLVNLLRAWSRAQSAERRAQGAPEWVLAIAGWDQGGHEAELKSLTSELGLAWMDVREAPPSPPRSGSAPVSGASFGVSPKESVSPFLGPWNAKHIPLGSVSAFQHVSVLFVGPQFNEDKVVCYQNCDAFILPSFSEGLPMVILEAWAHGKPVLMTPECNLPEGFAANAAIRVETSTESIAQGLQELFRTSHSALHTLGDNGRALVAGKFTWPKVAVEMKSVYEWVLGAGPKPECVQAKSCPVK